MTEEGRCREAVVRGLLLVALLAGCVRAEKPDTLRILTRHQQYRRLNQAADMMKMTWSANLERIAASVVEKCPTSVEAVRSQPELRNLGANLGFAPYPPPMQDGYPEDIQTSIIDKWGSERSNYYPDSGCAAQSCDSWWQIVWSNASQVGCSLKVCGDKSAMVCVYNSRADVGADAPFTAGPACSACPRGYRKCEQGMCVADKDAPVEPEFVPEFIPAAPSGGSADVGGQKANENQAEGEGDNSSRLTALLTTVVCVFIIHLLI